MLTHPSRAQNPEGEAAEGGAALAQGRKPKWGNRTSVAKDPQPHAKPPQQEEVGQPESARYGTPEG